MVPTALSECVFCQILAGERDEGVIAYMDESVAVLPSRDQRPRNLGHMLVVTRQHFETLHEMPSDLDGDVMACLRRTALAVRRTFDSSGTTITQNIGLPGQDVFHTHFHVIPRYGDDDNLSSPYEVINFGDSDRPGPRPHSIICRNPRMMGQRRSG